MFPRNDVPFGGCVDTASHLGVKSPKKILGHKKAFSSQMHKIFKLSYYKNYSMDYNQILSDDKDLQVLLIVDDPTNPRWRMADGCHREKKIEFFFISLELFD